MTQDDSNWIAVKRSVLPKMAESRISDALDELSSFIASESNPRNKSDALGYRAEIKIGTGDLEGARDDLLNAINLVVPSYMRYVHELRLGDVHRQLGELEDSIQSYRSALRTCLNSNETSGGNALKALLDLTPEATLSISDRALCADVVNHSRKVLRLKSQIEIGDLASAVLIIRNAETRPGRPAP